MFIAAAPDVFAAYASHLQDNGYAVSHSLGVTEAVAEAQGHCPDLVFLDLGESSKLGLAMLGELKADDCLGAIPLVLLAPFDCLDDIYAGLEMGACDYIIKTETSVWALARGVPAWARVDGQVQQGLRESAAKAAAITARRWGAGPRFLMVPAPRPTGSPAGAWSALPRP